MVLQKEETEMGDKGKRDKSKREEQKKGKLTLKEKRNQKKGKAKSVWENESYT
jgi:hypothetical protein